MRSRVNEVSVCWLPWVSARSCMLCWIKTIFLQLISFTVIAVHVKPHAMYYKCIYSYTVHTCHMSVMLQQDGMEEVKITGVYNWHGHITVVTEVLYDPLPQKIALT